MRPSSNPPPNGTGRRRIGVRLAACRIAQDWRLPEPPPTDACPRSWWSVERPRDINLVFFGAVEKTRAKIFFGRLLCAWPLAGCISTLSRPLGNKL